MLASLLTAALANLMRLSSPEFSGLSVMTREKVAASSLEQFKIFQRRLLEGQGQNLALTGLCVPNSLDFLTLLYVARLLDCRVCRSTP